MDIIQVLYLIKHLYILLIIYYFFFLFYIQSNRSFDIFLSITEYFIVPFSFILSIKL